MADEQCLVGRFEPYITGDDFADYLDQAENYFELNAQTTEARKVRLFLNLVGPSISSKIFKSFKRERCLSKKFDEVFARCKELVSGECQPTEECAELNGRQQMEGEQIEHFAVPWQTAADKVSVDRASLNSFVAGLLMSDVDELEYLDFFDSESSADDINTNALNSIILGSFVDDARPALVEQDVYSARLKMEVDAAQLEKEDGSTNHISWLCADHGESTAAKTEALKVLSSLDIHSFKAEAEDDQRTSGNTITAVLATQNEVIKKKAEFSRSFHDAGGVERLMNITKQRQKRTALTLFGHLDRRHSTWLHKVVSLGFLNEQLQLLELERRSCVFDFGGGTYGSSRRLNSYLRLDILDFFF